MVALRDSECPRQFGIPSKARNLLFCLPDEKQVPRRYAPRNDKLFLRDRQSKERNLPALVHQLQPIRLQDALDLAAGVH
jgi:hypothetical protein